jgi:hypothetical protein
MTLPYASNKSQKKKKSITRVPLGRISDVNIGAGILPHNISTECNIPSL